jgi:Domain of unknown function (DUF929)
MVILVVVIVVVGSGVAYLIYQQVSAPSPPSGAIALLNTPISSALDQNLTGVSYSTLSTVGQGEASSPSAISPAGQNFTVDGKPGILYIGGEFCPLCAVERWALVVALSKFGNFTNLQYMISAPDDGNIYTLTFLNATYSSKYIGLATVENEDRNRNTLQTPTTTEQNLWSTYNPGYYPFIYFDGMYAVKTNQFDVTILEGMNWTQIASQLNSPSTTVAKAVDGAANTMISAVCAMDGGNPSSVCGESFAKLLSFQNTSPTVAPDSAFLLANAEPEPYSQRIKML